MTDKIKRMIMLSNINSQYGKYGYNPEMKAKITRKEAREFITKQLNDETPASDTKNPRPAELHMQAHHYGKCELEELLDQIYGPPTPTATKAST